MLRLARLAVRPLDRFLQIQAASSILLLLAALAALVWANSPWSASYVHLWHTPVGVRLGSMTFERSLEWLVNDGLMVIFFFVVGMEIRRELHHGELSEIRRAVLPVAAALGGMLAPAALYLLLAGAPPTRSGWGIPMATDIAFAVGVLALLGKRVPPALRVLLLALAVIDDLGAIVVIALFYSTGIVASGLVVAALGFGGILVMQRFGVRARLAYVAPGVVLWAGVSMAGIHPTIAGVIIGLVTPVRAWLGADGFLTAVQHEVDQLATAHPRLLSTQELAEALRHVDQVRREAMSPAEGLIETLHPWVAFGIMPIFALANAGVALSKHAVASASTGVVFAVGFGLVVGKPVGILFACWLTTRLRIAVLPTGLTVRHLLVLGLVAGVGFTMAIFIAQLAFTEPSLVASAKLGILVASGLAVVLGLTAGRVLLAAGGSAGAARTADEAESSTEM